MTKNDDVPAVPLGTLTSRSVGSIEPDHGSGTRRLMVDVHRLVSTRCLINANSGAGKSWTVRRLLETSHGMVPHHVIDPEGEFHTLRDRFDYVLAGRPGGQKGDCPAEPRSAALLARKLLELGVSAVIDLFELDPRDRIRFVRLYLEAMLDAPRALWRPTLVVVDEAHTFCPEKGEAEAESRDAVIGLMSRGRKRGFGGVLATQRLAKLHKSAAAECNNVLIGRTSLDVDLERAGRALGYDRNARQQLRRLAPGTFHAVGPALLVGSGGARGLPLDGVAAVAVDQVHTRHPQAGQGAAQVAPPRAAVQKVLAELEALPAAAEAQERTVDALTARVAVLERQLEQARRAATAPTPVAADALKRFGEVARATFRKETRNTLGLLEAEVLAAIRKVGNLALGPGGSGGAIDQAVTAAASAVTQATAMPASDTADQAGSRLYSTLTLTPQGRLLAALAWWEAIGHDAPALPGLAFMARYAPTSGTFANIRGKAHTDGLVEYPAPGRTRLTAAGRSKAPRLPVPTTNAGLHAVVLAELDGPGSRVMQVLLPLGTAGIATDDLARQAGYTPGSGTFANIRGRLRSLGLVEYGPGRTRASAMLYPEHVR